VKTYPDLQVFNANQKPTAEFVQYRLEEVFSSKDLCTLNTLLMCLPTVFSHCTAMKHRSVGAIRFNTRGKKGEKEETTGDMNCNNNKKSIEKKMRQKQ